MEKQTEEEKQLIAETKGTAAKKKKEIKAVGCPHCEKKKDFKSGDLQFIIFFRGMFIYFIINHVG